MAPQETAKDVGGGAMSDSEERSAGTGKLYTLTQIGQMASVSMPTLQKYKRNYQDRIPSVGEGRKQRYPFEAVAVLKELKAENLARRGRPPKAKSAKAASEPEAGARKLLTLTEISRITKISYPTVSRYVKVFLDRIPHVGVGRMRRFPKEAVAVFSQLRAESRPGRPPKAKTAAGSRGSEASNAALAARLQRLERAQNQLAREVASLAKILKKPLQVTIKGR